MTTFAKDNCTWLLNCDHHSPVSSSFAGHLSLHKRIQQNAKLGAGSNNTSSKPKMAVLSKPAITKPQSQCGKGIVLRLGEKSFSAPCNLQIAPSDGMAIWKLQKGIKLWQKEHGVRASMPHSHALTHGHLRTAILVVTSFKQMYIIQLSYLLTKLQSPRRNRGSLPSTYQPLLALVCFH